MANKSDLEIHLIFVTKYRKPCLTEPIMNFCIEHLKKECEKMKIEVKAIRGDQKNHIHMMLVLRPTHSISRVVQILKQTSRYYVWQTFPSMRKWYWYKDYLWSRGYFCCNIGNASKETIEHYINTQGD